MLDKKWRQVIAVASFFVLFLMLGIKSEAYELSEVETKAAPTQPITFQIRREGEKYVLENLAIEKNFGTIRSVTIEMPEGVQLKMTVPAGWTSSNKPGDKVINYILTANDSPAAVYQVLEKLNLLIQDETKTKGEVSISLSGEKVSSWKDPNGGVHYYKFVKKMVPWLDAYNAAKTERYKGLTGYLATITSPEEHDYIFNSIAKNPGWLGGTRMVQSAGGIRIMDQPSITNLIGSYNLAKDDWYWAAGPEAGTTFFSGKTRAGGGFAPKGIYDGWSPLEPNNSGGEYVLQFALNKTKWWNDIDNGRLNATYNEGYFVEFSAYGNQVEIEENSHSADVPQLVTVQYLDQDNQQPLTTETLTGTTFSIGEPYTTTAKEIEGYDLVTTPTNANGSYSKEPTTVIYYYSKQLLTFHLQQVVVNQNNQVVIPSKGYTEIKNVDAQKPTDVTIVNERMNVLVDSFIGDGEVYTVTYIRRNPAGRYYQLEASIPEYYQYQGYVLTDKKEPHAFVNKQDGIPVIDGNGSKEYWVTFYVQPMTIEPLPYSWHYTSSKIGSMN